MTDVDKDRLLTWTPGAPGFSRDEATLAIGLQCREKQFAVKDVLEWLGPPQKVLGDAAAGQIAYLYSGDSAGVFPMFSVAEGKVVGFSAVARFENNAKRTDPETGEEIQFNILDVMQPFDESVFM